MTWSLKLKCLFISLLLTYLLALVIGIF